MRPFVWRFTLASILLITTRAHANGSCEELDLPLAQTTRLKPFLEQLAVKRNFQLHYWTIENPDVRIFRTSDDVELMTSLPSEANIMVSYSAARAGCGTAWRIKTVWVLPSGPANPTRSYPPPQRAVHIDQATRDYLQAHGILVESR